MLMIGQRNVGRSGISAPKRNEEMLLGSSMILLAFYYNCHLQGGDKNGGMKDPRLGKDPAVCSRDVL
jgi:hypothetical protein